MSQMDADKDVERDAETSAIIGAAMVVHGQLGHGFLEAVYHEALALELLERGIPFKREVPLVIKYKQRELSCSYQADLICYGHVLVELKALARLSGVEHAQVLNYLKATGLSRALLVNFGAPRLEYVRLVLNHLRPSATSADET
jgi:GxxExxY protein